MAQRKTENGKGVGATTGGGDREFDRHDEEIIARLREDGRMSVRELATKVELNEATVRARMRRLEAEDAMRIVAMIDMSAVGVNFIAPVGVQVRGRSAEDVGLQLAEIPQIISISAAIGVQDLELQVACKSMEELNEILTINIPAVEGVARVEAALASTIIKYESPWVPFI